jgi:hypothetical protein
MRKLWGLAIVLAAAAMSLGLTSAIGNAATSPAKTRHVQGPIEALALDGSNVAYDVGSTTGKADNKVVVWNVRTGKTTTVSGKHTRGADDSSTGSAVFQVAIAGTRVAWLVNVGGNSEGDDYLYTSSTTSPHERQVATEQRLGDSCPGRSEANCAGGWLGGLVGSGNLIAVNTWETDGSGSVVAGALSVLSGTTMKPVATGIRTVEAAFTDGRRVAAYGVGTDVNVYSSTGSFLLATSLPNFQAAVLRGKNIIELTTTRRLEIWDPYAAVPLQKTLALKVRPKQPAGNLDAQGNIAIYTTGPWLRAINLSSGKDRVIGTLRGGVASAHISSAGVVYSTGRLRSKGTLVFLPLARVAAAVAG